jgi:hypothetical protein
MRGIGTGAMALMVVGLMTACGHDLATYDPNDGSDLTAEEEALNYGRNLVMTCAETNGSAPGAYKYVQCDFSGFKADSLIGPCVDAVDPDVYGGQSCFPPQRIQADGTWSVAFALLGGKTYTFNTYGVRRGELTRTVLVSTTATIAP